MHFTIFGFFKKINGQFAKVLQNTHKNQNLKFLKNLKFLQGLNCIWIIYFENLMTIHLLWSYNILVYLSILLHRWRSMLRFPSLRSTMRRFTICWPPPRKKEERNLRSVILGNSLFTFFPLNKPITILAHLSRMLTSSCSDIKDYRI